MARYFAIDRSGNVRQSDTPPPVVTNEVVGAANGVDLTIRGAVGQSGTYTNAGNINIVGGKAGTGYYTYAGNVYINGGDVPTGATSSYSGTVEIQPGAVPGGIYGTPGRIILSGNAYQPSRGAILITNQGGIISLVSPEVKMPALAATAGSTGDLFNNSGTVGQPGTIEIS